MAIIEANICRCAKKKYKNFIHNNKMKKIYIYKLAVYIMNIKNVMMYYRMFRSNPSSLKIGAVNVEPREAYDAYNRVPHL